MPENRRATPDRLHSVDTRIRVQISDLVAAYRMGDVDSMLPFFAPNVIFMPADRPAARGLAALRQYFARTFVLGEALISLDSDRFVVADGVAVDRGTYHRRAPRGGGHPSAETGSYELTWRRQDDGEYRVTSWIFTRSEHSHKDSRHF